VAEWYHKHPMYPNALRLAKRLIRDQLVGDQWEPEQLSSWLVRPLAAAMDHKPRKPAKKKGGRRG
jgi:hypothetical protein